MRMPSWRRASSRATARPTIPAPTTTTSHSRGALPSGGGDFRTAPVSQYDRYVALPLKPPIEPQLALSRNQLPEGEGWAYEPKYDGFRALAFVDGDDVFLQS